jgi:hypothetical protein
MPTPVARRRARLGDRRVRLEHTRDVDVTQRLDDDRVRSDDG